MIHETLDIFTTDEDRMTLNLNASISLVFFWKCKEYTNSTEINLSAYVTTICLQLVPKLIHSY